MRLQPVQNQQRTNFGVTPDIILKCMAHGLIEARNSVAFLKEVERAKLPQRTNPKKVPLPIYGFSVANGKMQAYLDIATENGEDFMHFVDNYQAHLGQRLFLTEVGKLTLPEVSQKLAVRSKKQNMNTFFTFADQLLLIMQNKGIPTDGQNFLDFMKAIKIG